MTTNDTKRGLTKEERDEIRHVLDPSNPTKRTVHYPWGDSRLLRALDALDAADAENFRWTVLIHDLQTENEMLRKANLAGKPAFLRQIDTTSQQRAEAAEERERVLLMALGEIVERTEGAEHDGPQIAHIVAKDALEAALKEADGEWKLGEIAVGVCQEDMAALRHERDEARGDAEREYGLRMLAEKRERVLRTAAELYVTARDALASLQDAPIQSARRLRETRQRYTETLASLRAALATAKEVEKELDQTRRWARLWKLWAKKCRLSLGLSNATLFALERERDEARGDAEREYGLRRLAEAEHDRLKAAADAAYDMWKYAKDFPECCDNAPVDILENKLRLAGYSLESPDAK